MRKTVAHFWPVQWQETLVASQGLEHRRAPGASKTQHWNGWRQRQTGRLAGSHKWGKVPQGHDEPDPTCPGVAEGPRRGQNAAMTSPAQPTGEEREGLGTTPPHRGARKHPCKACLNKSSDLWQPRAVVTADPAVPSAVQVEKLPQVRAPPTQVGETCRAEAGLGTTAQGAKLEWGRKPEATKGEHPRMPWGPALAGRRERRREGEEKVAWPLNSAPSQVGR